MEKKEQTTFPTSVMVQGQKVNVTVDKKGAAVTDKPDPRAAIKKSSFDELLPASDDWVAKHGGSEISIVAFNVAELLKEKADGKENKDKTKD